MIAIPTTQTMPTRKKCERFRVSSSCFMFDAVAGAGTRYGGVSSTACAREGALFVMKNAAALIGCEIDCGCFNDFMMSGTAPTQCRTDAD